ncbi:hypothetical protein [Chryseobacterium tongliaoense]|uniref:hypothetical protein n=1 Tax=Chryseobacterium tongliaoense TaxID=3240933 RepID=UPI0035158413
MKSHTVSVTSDLIGKKEVWELITDWLWNLLVVKRIVKDTPKGLRIIVEQIKDRYEKQYAF